jgi:hypothetical protein
MISVKMSMKITIELQTSSNQEATSNNHGREMILSNLIWKTEVEVLS